jgi:hypothetical protein
MLMKARSKAAKRARKRGRPRLPAMNGDREPNGRLTRRRSAVEGHVMDVAISRRIRHQGIVGPSGESIEKAAVDPRRGYVLGLLLLGDRISEAQHAAGLRYGADMARYYRLSGVQFPSPRAQDLFAVRGESGETVDRALAVKSAHKRMRELHAVLLGTGDIDTGRRVEYTVRSVCLLDLPDSAWSGRPFRSDFLVRGLNSLVRYYNGELS